MHACTSNPRRLTAWTALLGLLLFLLTVAPVWAHAALERTEPAPNQVLDASPGVVRAFFTEAVEPAFSDVRVLTVDGTEVHLRDLRASENRRELTVSVPPDLPRGIYRVSWRALSAVDGHVLRGTFLFSVQEPIPGGEVAGVNVQLDVPQPTALGVGVRIATYTLFALLTGLLLLRFMLLRHATWPESALRRLGNLALLVIVLSAVAAVMTLVDQGLRSAGGEGFDGAAIASLLQTRAGLTVVARLALLAALFFLIDEVLFTAPNLGAVSFGDKLLGTGLVIAEVGALGLMIALNSHSAAAGNVVQIGLDLVHLLAMGGWFGGLFTLAAVLPFLTRGWPPIPQYVSAIRRFSTLALISVVLLGATGTYQAAALAGGLDLIRVTPYGLTLTIKVGLFLVLIALAAVNLLVLRPRLGGLAGEGARRWLGRSIVAEAVIALAVLGSVSLLTSQQPSRQFLTSAVGQGSIVQVERTPGLTIVFATDPRVLENARYQVTLTEGFEPVTDAEAVRLRFRNLLAPLGISDLEAQYLGSGIYVAQGTPTPVDGFWEAEVQVVRPNRVDAAAQFRYPTGRSLQFAQGDGWRLPPLDGLTFGGIGLLLLGILALRFRTRVRQQVLRNLMFGLAAFGFLAGGTALTSHAHTVPPNVAGLVNPVPATAQSVNTGRLLYEANCLACHGVRGRGDGPLARSLNPPPLDLMVHGPVHTDGELFGWISEGVTGTAMPSFADRLTETERWHLVNYLRSITAAPR